MAEQNIELMVGVSEQLNKRLVTVSVVENRPRDLIVNLAIREYLDKHEQSASFLHKLLEYVDKDIRKDLS